MNNDNDLNLHSMTKCQAGVTTDFCTYPNKKHNVNSEMIPA